MNAADRQTRYSDWRRAFIREAWLRRLPRLLIAPLLPFLVISFSCKPNDSAEAFDDHVTHIMGSSTCPTCELRLTEVAILGSADGPGALESEAVIVRQDKLGRYFVFNELGSSINVYGATGEYITTIGRPGSGPGEYRAISSVAFSAGDSVNVFDMALTRQSLYSPTLEYLHSRILDVPPSSRAVLLPENQLVIAAAVPTADLAGLPLHLLDETGRRIRSFGAANPIFDVRTTSGLRFVANAGDTAVWVAHWNRYRLELWSVGEGENRPLLVFDRDVPWFPPGIEDKESVDLPPATRVVDLRVDDGGRLLVLTRVADDRWREAVEMKGREKSVIDRHGYFDTILEVIDPSSGSLIAAERFPYMLGSFIADNMVSAVISDSSYIPYVKVWRVQLHE